MKGLLNQWIDKRISDIHDAKGNQFKTPDQSRLVRKPIKDEFTQTTPRGSIMGRRESAFTDTLGLPVKQRQTPNHLSLNSPQKEQRVSTRRMLALDPDNPFNTETTAGELPRSRSHNKKHFVEISNQGIENEVTYIQYPARTLKKRVLNPSIRNVGKSDRENNTFIEFMKDKQRQRMLFIGLQGQHQQQDYYQLRLLASF